MTRAVSFFQSVRFRLSVLYSSVVFGLGGAVLGVTYWVIRRDLEGLPLVVDSRVVDLGRLRLVLSEVGVDEARLLEQVVGQRALALISNYFVVALVVLFLLSIVVGWVVSGRALRPVDRISTVARDIQASDLSRRIALRGPDDELTRLADTFDAMLERLDTAFRSQRRFLADTSHDLRTPLAVIRSNVDVTIEDEAATVADWRETGQIISRNADRMAGMLDDLLAAARLEVGVAAKVATDLAALVEEAAAEVGAVADRASVSLTITVEGAPVAGVPAALRRALGNLVDNALKVAPPGSTVVLGAGLAGSWGWMAVADEGPGIDEAVMSSQSTGGLGLGIVRQIAEAHGGVLRAHRRRPTGSVLVVWVPRADPEESPPEHLPLPGL